MLRRTMLMAAAVLTLAAPAQARTWRIAPDADAEQQIAAALASAQAGDEVRLERGRYEMRAPLRMDARGVTLRGAGEDRSVLAFVGAQGGLVITGDMGVVRDLAIEDAPGDGVSARRCDQLSLLGVRVEWTRGGLPSNGAHAIAAAQCANVLIDGAIARGARAAGFYLSQTRAVVLRNSTAEGNGAGVMLENTLGADVHDNSVRNNALGVLVLNRPDLGGGGEAGDVLIAKNMIEANSLASFAPRGALPGDAPGGVGVAIIAGRNTHVLHNQIADNPSVNVFIGAYRGAVAQAGFNPLSRDIAVRDNRLGRSGFAPSGDLARAGVPLPDILWDGATTYSAGGAPHSEIVRLSLDGNRGADGDGAPTFLSLGIPIAGVDISEAAPETALLNVSRLPAPPDVRLPQD